MGANLQVFATQQMLRRMGFQPVVINYIDPLKLQAFDKIVPSKQVEEHENFANRFLNLSPALYSGTEIADYCVNSLDAIVVGSELAGTRSSPWRR